MNANTAKHTITYITPKGAFLADPQRPSAVVVDLIATYSTERGRARAHKALVEHYRSQIRANGAMAWRGQALVDGQPVSVPLYADDLPL